MASGLGAFLLSIQQNLQSGSVSPTPDEPAPEMPEAVGKYIPGKMYQTVDREIMAARRKKYAATNRQFRLASLGA